MIKVITFFADKPIAEWLAKQNPSQLEYQRAVDNFTLSCAGYGYKFINQMSLFN